MLCSASAEVQGTFSVADVRDPRELQGVDVGIVRAAFGVAETGSVAVSEREFGVNALGFLSQHLVVLLDPASIVADLHAAYWQPWFREVRYAALMTGPSATADIEGVPTVLLARTDADSPLRSLASAALNCIRPASS